MSNEEILERLKQMEENFKEEGLQGYEMTIINTINLINKLIAKNNDYEEGIILSDKQLSMVMEGIKAGAEEQIAIEMKNYIHKDRIKEFIKEETKEGTYNFKTISAKRLKELLEQ